MLYNNEKQLREIGKRNRTDDHMANDSDSGRLYFGNVHHKAWNDAGVGFLSPHYSVLFSQRGFMEWGRPFNFCFLQNKVFNIKKGKD